MTNIRARLYNFIVNGVSLNASEIGDLATDAHNEIVVLHASLRQIRDMEVLPDYEAEVAALQEAEQEIGKLEILMDSTDAQQRASMKLIATRVLKELGVD